MEFQLPTFTIEAVTSHFLLRGNFQPRGEFFTYINDRRYLSFNFAQAEFSPMPSGYRLNVIKQESLNINWRMVTYIGLTAAADLERIQFLQSKRPITFYTDLLAIRGNLHVNLDAHENDLLDETRDFLAVTAAAVYPMRSLATKPTRELPLMALNRHHVLGYHGYEP